MQIKSLCLPHREVQWELQQMALPATRLKAKAHDLLPDLMLFCLNASANLDMEKLLHIS